jgi:hypothetical protein
MVFLFALCIIAPGTLFGYLSLRQVEMKFHQETIHRMRIQSREVAMAIHGGFTSVEIQVNFLASMFRNGTFPPTRPLPDQGWMFQKGPLLGAALFREGSRPESWFGNPFPPPSASHFPGIANLPSMVRGKPFDIKKVKANRHFGVDRRNEDF